MNISVRIVKQDDFTIIVEAQRTSLGDKVQWHRLATFARDYYANDLDRAGLDAADWARVWVSGARFAGATVTASNQGYNL